MWRSSVPPVAHHFCCLPASLTRTARRRRERDVHWRNARPRHARGRVRHPHARGRAPGSALAPVLWCVRPACVAAACTRAYVCVLCVRVRVLSSFAFVPEIESPLHRGTHAGEGVPNHAIQTSPGSVNGSFFGFPSPIPVSLHYGPDGYPLTSDCLKIMFGAYYFSFACASAWQVRPHSAWSCVFLWDVDSVAAFVRACQQPRALLILTQRSPSTTTRR